MANEAVLIQDLEYRHMEITVADNVAIPKGTILSFQDPTKGVASAGDNELFIGILLEEKVVNSGVVRVAVSRHGVWDIKLTTATVTVGDTLKVAGANLVATADDDTVNNFTEVVGIALQTGANDEVIEVLVGAF